MGGGFKWFTTMGQSPELAVLKILIIIKDSYLFPRHTNSEHLVVVQYGESLDGLCMITE
jgi:hypothetical protein